MANPLKDKSRQIKEILYDRLKELICEADAHERKMAEYSDKALEAQGSLEDMARWRNAFLGEKTVHNCRVNEINFLREVLEHSGDGPNWKPTTKVNERVDLIVTIGKKL